MKWFLTALLFLHAHTCLAGSHFIRSWSRSSLDSLHFGFRHLNNMSPILSENLVLVGNSVDGLKAFRRDSGAEVWNFQVKNGLEGLTLDKDKIYFGAGDGFFYCLNLSSGQVEWKKNLNSESLTRPLVVGPYVYHVAGNSTLYVFNKDNGEAVWVKTNAAKANMTVRGQTTPVLENGILYVGWSDGTFTALNAQNGREIWSKRIGDDKKFNDVDATPVLTANCILVSSFANALFCLDKTNGSIRWRHDFGGYQSVFVSEDKVYYSTLNGEIHILDSASGKLLKKITNIRGMASQLQSVGPYLVYGESQGALVVRNRDNLKKVFQFNPGRGVFAAPTLDTRLNQIYISSRERILYRFDIRNSASNPFPWSQ